MEPGRNYSILIVEADDRQYRVFEHALQQAGVDLDVHRACDAATAIDFLSQSAQSPGSPARPLPRLILLDNELPNRHSFDVLEMVRGEPGLRGIVVIMLGSSDQPEEVERAYELGVNSYVTKPPFDTYGQLFAAIKGYWLGCNEQPDWLLHSSLYRRKPDRCTAFAGSSVFL